MIGELIMQPLVSVIVPIYNARDYLVECITSIQNQTYDNLEIILVNDGSTDDSLEICTRFAISDSRICVINQNNMGVSSARNRGIEVARGTYIGFVDSDDYLNREMYEKLVEVILLNDVEASVLMEHTIKPFNPQIMNRSKLDSCEALKELFLLRLPTSLWAYLYNREVIKNLRLDTNIHFFEDFEFNYRVLKTIKGVALCFNNMYYYRTHDLSTNSQALNPKRMTCLEIYELHKKEIQQSECDLIKYSLFFRCHFLISIMISIAKSNKSNKECIIVTNDILKTLYFECFLSKIIPLDYKLAIFIFSIHPKLFKFFMKIKREIPKQTLQDRG